MEEKRCYGCMRPMGDNLFCGHCGYDSRKQNAAHQLPVGTVLKGQYTIGRVLGQGGFGITYLGWDNYLNIPVAIKEYYPTGIVMRDVTRSLSVSNCEGNSGTQFAHNRERFLREAQSLGKLSNVPEVVHVLGFFPENDTAYIVMEYIQGKTLKRLVKESGTLSPRQMMDIFLPVIDGLEKVHEAGLIHRDISPDNIMILPDGRVKLLDFGAVRDFSGTGSLSTQAILKHGYAPLEQYQRRGEMGTWTDVYALCGTIYYCMTGQVPPDAPERMMENIEPNWDQISGLTLNQLAALKKGTALLADSRVQTARELKSLLEKPDAPQPPKPEPVPAKPAPSQKPAQTKPEKKSRQKRPFPILPVLLILVAAAAALVLFYGSMASGTEPEPSAPEVSESAPETTAPTEETLPEATAEPVYPCYVTYTDQGMIITGEDLRIEVCNNQDLMITAEGFPVVDTYTIRANDSGIYDRCEWAITLIGPELSYKLSTYSYTTGETRDVYPSQLPSYMRASVGPDIYDIDSEIETKFHKNGIFWRCRVASLTETEYVRPIAFNFQDLTQFEVSVGISTVDTDSNVSYHRLYEIVGETPADQVEPPREEPRLRRGLYPEGFVQEKYTYTTTVTAEGTLIKSDHLEIFCSNDRELTITMDGIYVDDSYFVRPSALNSGYVWYGFAVLLHTNSGYLEIGTSQSTMGEGGTYWIDPEYMEHSLRWVRNQNGAYYPITDVEFQEDRITWHCRIPETVYDTSIDFDIQDVVKLEAIAWHMHDRMSLTRTYTPD